MRTKSSTVIGVLTIALVACTAIWSGVADKVSDESPASGSAPAQAGGRGMGMMQGPRMGKMHQGLMMGAGMMGGCPLNRAKGRRQGRDGFAHLGGPESGAPEPGARRDYAAHA